MLTDSRSLSDITVVEIGSFIAAPFATMQLADLGARVIKVESPGSGDFVRGNAPFVEGESSSFLRLNRNKESVELDLKSDEGLASFHELVRRADVLVENLRPGALRRLGLGYEDLAQENPGLVYASASGWGQDGPLAHLPGLDIMAQARSGLMSVTGFPVLAARARPMPSTPPCAGAARPVSGTRSASGRRSATSGCRRSMSSALRRSAASAIAPAAGSTSTSH